MGDQIEEGEGVQSTSPYLFEKIGLEVELGWWRGDYNGR
jgi:hypothetical protein